ncbi:unnamed protein product [Phytomonas sp. Hart1]|nr:unnamed protein product [Phytomonas sp. Hart1]|eukprot:CCW70503.1 unnamed protein product [Phytomonas sp. isolate Hart1]
MTTSSIYFDVNLLLRTKKGCGQYWQFISFSTQAIQRLHRFEISDFIPNKHNAIISRQFRKSPRRVGAASMCSCRGKQNVNCAGAFPIASPIKLSISLSETSQGFSGCHTVKKK